MRILLTSTAAAAILVLSACGSENREPDAGMVETNATDMDPALPAEGEPGAQRGADRLGYDARPGHGNAHAGSDGDGSLAARAIAARTQLHGARLVRTTAKPASPVRRRVSPGAISTC
jgi:hypothetical protein